MFGFFKKRMKVKQARLLPDIAQLSVEEATRVLLTTFEGQHASIGALFLVAYDNFAQYYAMFAYGNFSQYYFMLNITEQEDKGPYDRSLRGFAECMADCQAEPVKDDIVAGLRDRITLYLYLAALLKMTQAKAREDSAVWDSVARVWVSLMPGARALRATIDRTSLWPKEETQIYSTLVTEDDGEQYVWSLLVPEEIRFHRLFVEWQERDLSDEIKEEIIRTMRPFQRWLSDK